MTDYNYDPDLIPLLPLLPKFGDLSDVDTLKDARSGILFGEPVERDDVLKEDRQVPGPEGAPEVAIRIYRPKTDGESPRPCVFEIHGGGFILGSIDMMDPWCQAVAVETDAVVVSVGYRLAPEDPFPAGLEDCYAAPSRAKDLSGLPPAYISTMEFDPLRDEGILYGLALLQAGVSVELHSYAGTFHGSAMIPTAETRRGETARKSSGC